MYGTSLGYENADPGDLFDASGFVIWGFCSECNPKQIRLPLVA
jgi:hypothetical protein